MVVMHTYEMESVGELRMCRSICICLYVIQFK